MPITIRYMTLRSWTIFLNSLATEGGTIFVLLCLSMVLLAVFGWTHVDVVKDSFMLTLGALLSFLKSQVDDDKNTKHFIAIDKMNKELEETEKTDA